jgi:cytochrome P450
VASPDCSGALSRAERLQQTPSLSGFRSMVKYKQQPLRRFEDARLVSDRMVAFQVLGIPYVTLFDLKAIEQVLVTDHAVYFKDSFTQDLRRMLGTGLLTSEGELWRRRRKLTAPAFQRREVSVYGGVIAERAEAFVRSQETGVVVDVHSALMHLSLDILVRALFGTRVSRAADVEHLLDRLMMDYLPAAAAWRVALPEWFPLSSRSRLGKGSARSRAGFERADGPARAFDAGAG